MTDPTTNPTTNPTAAPTTELPYRYFVSYNWGAGWGSIEVFLAQPVNGFADIDAFTGLAFQSIRRDHPYLELDKSQVVIVNYQLLSGPANGGTPEQALREVLSMVDQFDTPRDPGRVRAFVGDVRQVASRGLGGRRG